MTTVSKKIDFTHNFGYCDLDAPHRGLTQWAPKNVSTPEPFPSRENSATGPVLKEAPRESNLDRNLVLEEITRTMNSITILRVIEGKTFIYSPSRDIMPSPPENTLIDKYYDDRIKWLESEYATEGITINESSKEDFWDFVQLVKPGKEGHLFLMDNGHLGIFWKDEKENKAELEFIGDGQVAFLITIKQDNGERNRKFGTIELSAIMPKIRAHDLSSLIYT